MAIAVSKHIEIKTEVSIREFITQAKKITDARLMNQINKKEITMRVPVTRRSEKLYRTYRLMGKVLENFTLWISGSTSKCPVANPH